MNNKRKILSVLVLALLITACFAAFALGADVVQIDAGIQTADKQVLATKLKDIFTGLGYFIGVVAVGSLIFNAFRLVTSSQEQKRAEVKISILWSLGAVVLAALSLMIVGYITSLVGSTTTGIMMLF